MRVVLAMVVAVLVSACSTQAKVLSSSPRTVQVQSFKGMADAQRLADSECAKHGRLARWTAGDLDFIFDCVQ